MNLQSAYKYSIKVEKDGRVSLSVPFPAGSNVTVFVIEESDDFKDLLAASETSLDFWDNGFDDEDWNDA